MDGLWVPVIAAGLALASARFARRAWADVGRTVLPGLEFLLAGDMIRTVAMARRWRTSSSWG